MIDLRLFKELFCSATYRDGKDKGVAVVVWTVAERDALRLKSSNVILGCKDGRYEPLAEVDILKK